MSWAIRRTALLIALVIVIAGATGAAATDSRATNQLTGCRNTATGTIDQVKAGLIPIGRRCSIGEVRVTWNKTGPAGPQGPAGPAGPAGGIVGLETVRNQLTSDSVVKSISVVCPEGKVVIGGGAATDYPHAFLGTSLPAYNQWQAAARNTGGSTTVWTLTVYAVCVSAP